MRYRWIITLGVVGALGVSTAAAHAQVSVPQTLTCEVSIGGEFSPGMAPQGGSGTYSATTAGLIGRNHCVWDTRGLFFANVTTRGAYTATSCGTGVLTGDPDFNGTVIEFTGGPQGGFRGILLNRLTYTLELRNWQAILRVSHVHGRPELGGDDVDGVFTVVPQHLCRSAPVSWYSLDGSFTVTW